MADRDRPDYCAQCGSFVHPEDNFCGVCGARVPPNAPANAPDDAPTQEMPALGNAPPRAPARDRNLGLAMLIGAGVVLVLALVIGSVAAVTLLGKESNPPQPPGRKEAAAGASDTTAPEQDNDKTTVPRTAGEASDAEKNTQQPSSEEAPGPAPGYNLIRDPGRKPQGGDSPELGG